MEQAKQRRKVKALLKKPQLPQRTPEWHQARYTRITASEAASCLYRSERACKAYVEEFQILNFKYKESESMNPYESREEYIIKKCSGFYGEYKYKDTPHTLWGKKYEEVANRLYEKIKGVKVYEFGLVLHSRLKWLAASPDGITEDGVMLEIKCPKSRKIDGGAPPLYYWVQCQIQMQSCDLDSCDFLECEIQEVETEEEFLGIKLEGPQDFGIILQKTTESEAFLYPPKELNSSTDYIAWKNDLITKDPTLKPLYFYITKYNIIQIKRSNEWFEAVRDDIKKTWEIVMKLQKSKDDFQKYKESIYLLKNKKYLEKWNQTDCAIGDDDTDFMLGETETNVNECGVLTSE